jgi:hypothetical protein
MASLIVGSDSLAVENVIHTSALYDTFPHSLHSVSLRYMPWCWSRPWDEGTATMTSSHNGSHSFSSRWQTEWYVAIVHSSKPSVKNAQIQSAIWRRQPAPLTSSFGKEAREWGTSLEWVERTLINTQILVPRRWVTNSSTKRNKNRPLSTI